MRDNCFCTLDTLDTVYCTTGGTDHWNKPPADSRNDPFSFSLMNLLSDDHGRKTHTLPVGKNFNSHAWKQTTCI